MRHYLKSVPAFIVSPSTVNLGVILDSDLNFNSYMKSITKSNFYHLKYTVRIRNKCVHAFISCRLNYCN